LFDDSKLEFSIEFSEASKQIIGERLGEKQKGSRHQELQIETRRSCDMDDGATNAFELPLLIINIWEE
jgi:hypothetical protein